MGAPEIAPGTTGYCQPMCNEPCLWACNATALVVALHGGGSSAKQMERETRFDAIAAREQFIVVYPEGIGHHWHDGRPGVGEAEVDDVGSSARSSMILRPGTRSTAIACSRRGSPTAG